MLKKAVTDSILHHVEYTSFFSAAFTAAFTATAAVIDLDLPPDNSTSICIDRDFDLQQCYISTKVTSTPYRSRAKYTT